MPLFRAPAIELSSPSVMFSLLRAALPRRFGRARLGMAKPAVLLVGADKGGVGKTIVSRALLDYFIAHFFSNGASATESPKGTLKRFHPDVTEVVNMHST